MQSESRKPSTSRLENFAGNIRILRKPTVLRRTGLGNSMLYSLMSQGLFPRQIKLGPRASGWIEFEVDDWIAARISDSRGKSV